MNKSYKIKQNCIQILILCSFVQVYFLKKIYSILIFNIADLILLEKNVIQKKNVDKFTYIIWQKKMLQLKNMRDTSPFDYTILLRRQINNYNVKKKQFIFINKLKYFDLFIEYYCLIIMIKI